VATNWIQCNFIQTTPTWADAACNISPDTHDGGDYDRRRKKHDAEQKERIRRYRRDREHLRDTIRAAFEARYEPAVAALSPYMAQDMAAGPQTPIDYGALLTAASALRALADFEERMGARMREIDDDDDEVLLLL
jgi:hypothetical protein